MKLKGFVQKYSIELTLFFSLFFTYAYFYQGSGHNEAARFDATRAFVETGNFAIDKYWGNSADVIQYEKHTYSGKAPGTSLVGIIPFLLAKILTIFSPPETRYHWICYLTTILSVGLLSAFLSVGIYWFLSQIGGQKRDALVVSIVAALGTMAFPYSTLYISHTTAGACLFMCFYSIFYIFNERPSDRKKLFVILGGGFCGGFAVTSEYPAAIGLGLIHLYAAVVFLKKKDFRIWFYFIEGTIAGLIPLLIYNQVAFHNPFFIPYEAYAQAGSGFAAHQKGFLGIQNPLSNPLFLNVLRQITFNPQRGLFFLNPLLIVIIPGVFLAWRNWAKLKKEILLAALLFSFYLIFNASFGDSIIYWGGGYSFGPRYMIQSLPFLALFLLPVYQNKVLHKPFVFLSIISIFICFLATAIEPRVSYNYLNPITQDFLPNYLDSQFAMAREGVFSQKWMTENSAAFNLGKLLGLPLTFQFFPLVFIWLLALNFFEKKFHYSTWATNTLKAVLFVVLLVPLAFALREFNSLSGKAGLIGSYYDTDNLSGQVIKTRNDKNLQFNWENAPPLPPPFSAKWEGQLVIQKEGVYDFSTVSDDASWVWIDDQLVVDNSGAHGQKHAVGNTSLKVGNHPIRIEYVNYLGGAVLQVAWKPQGEPVFGAIPLDALLPSKKEKM